MINFSKFELLSSQLSFVQSFLVVEYPFTISQNILKCIETSVGLNDKELYELSVSLVKKTEI